MKNQDGKMTFISTLIILALIFGAFLGFKYLTTNFTKKEIKTEIFTNVGYMRGAGDLEAIRKEILTYLENKGVKPLKVTVQIERSNIIVFAYTYEIETNYLITVSKEEVTNVESIPMY